MTTPNVPRTAQQFEPGRDLGASQWVPVTQAMISGFGDVTLDLDPMHINPAWAAAGPFGTTIAFGFLTLSLLTHLLHDAMGTDSSHYDPAQGYFLNYGFNRVRLITPVKVGARIRGVFTVLDVRDDASARRITTFGATIEIEGGTRPALVAEWLTLAVPPAAA
jgi:acyl dehydratase